MRNLHPCLHVIGPRGNAAADLLAVVFALPAELIDPIVHLSNLYLHGAEMMRLCSQSAILAPLHMVGPEAY